MRKQPIRLTLPVPPDPNDLASAAHAHPMEVTKLKNRWRRQAWPLACQGDHPPTSTPPSPVLLKAVYRVAGGWLDPDNRTAGLKPVIDLLKKPGNSVPTWRGGLYETKGWIVDDTDEHLVLDGVPLRREVCCAGKEQLELYLVPLIGKKEEAGGGG